MTQLLYGRRPLPATRSNPLEVLGAAFSQENDVVNLLQLMDVHRPPVDADFDLQAEVAALPDQSIWDRHSTILARAQSREEFSALRLRVEEEERQRQLLAQAGWGGFAAGMFAGALSPTMLIPLVGGARGARGVAQAFGLAALGATASEIPLLANQELRTRNEAFMGIAAGTVLGGLLGSTAVYLRRADFETMAQALDPEVETAVRGVFIRDRGTVVRMGEQAAELNIPNTPIRPTRQETPWLAEDTGLDMSWTELRGTIEVGDRRFSYELPPVQEGNVRVFLTEDNTTTARIAEALQADNSVRYLDVPQNELNNPISPEIVPETVRVREMPAAAESTAGAQETRGMQIPVQESVDPATGKVTYDPIMSEAEALSMDPAMRVGEFAARTNPIARAVMQWDAPERSLVTARNMLRLSDGGISWRGSNIGRATELSGSVENRLHYYKALQARAYDKLYQAYGDYIRDGAAQTFVGKVTQRLQVEFNQATAGKLTFSQFSETVTEALNRGDVSDIPQVTEVARFWRAEVYAKVLEAADEAAAEWGAERLFKEIQFDQNHSYMTHVYSPDLVNADQLGFINTVADFVERSMNNTWTRKVQKAQRRGQAELDTAELLTLDADEVKELLAVNEDILKNAKENPSPQLDQINELRMQARDIVSAKVEEYRKLIEDHAGTFVTVEGVPRYIHKMSPTELRNFAREAVEDQRQALLDEADALEARLPEETLAGRDALRSVRAQNRVLRKSFAQLEERQAAALSQIERNEDLNLAAFQRVVSATQKFMSDLDKIAPEKLEAELARVQANWDKAWQAAKRGEEHLDRLEERLLLGQYTGKGALEESLRQTGRQVRADQAFNKLTKAMLRDRDALVAELQARLNTSIAYVDRVNAKRSERNALLRERIKSLDPQKALDEVEELMSKAAQRFETLEDALRKAGAEDIHVSAGGSDFSFKSAARDYATELANNITGNVSRLAQVDMSVGMRGPMKGRYLNIPYDTKKRWLEKDSEKVLDRYLRTMGSDIELFRAFGDRGGRRAVDEAIEDMTRIGLQMQETGVSAKTLARHQKAMQRRIQELEATIERIRGTRSLPTNPNALSYRLGRFFINWNVAGMMGSAAITSVPDAARVVFAHGMTKSLGDSWVPFLRGLVDESQGAANKALRRELQYMGIGVESFLHQRARNMLDILEPMANQSKVERGMEWLAQKTPVLGLLSAWSDGMKLITAAATNARLTRIIEDAQAGKATPDDIKYLAVAGIDERMVGRIAAQMEEHSTKYNGLMLNNVGDWTDYEAMRVWMAAMAREDQRLVITPGLEKPLWLDGSMTGRIIGQFRSFTMAANSKMLVAGLQTRGTQAMYAAQSAAISMALGALSYYIWAMSGPESRREEMRNASMGQWVDQALYRSGVLGAFEEARVIGAEIPLTRPLVTFGNSDLPGRRADSVLEAIAGPTFGKAGDIAQFLQGLDEPTEGTVRTARRLLPWQNIFWLRQAFDLLEQGTSSAFNLPETRR